jgi:hypothetical protein
MLQAQLRGKLTREEEDMEDLLTSNVFGAISYSLPVEGLIPFLNSLEDSEGDKFSVDLDIIKVDYSFWPWIEEENCNGCEPDVKIEIQLRDMRKLIFFVEAKYFSGKSSEGNEEYEAPYDQLAREWDNLQEFASIEHGIPFFIYITADLSYPKKSFAESDQDYKRYRSKGMRMFWTSWQRVVKVFSNRTNGYLKRDIFSDLVELLRRQGLTFYEGISRPKITEIKWLFDSQTNSSYDWTSYKRFNYSWKYFEAQKALI